MEDSSVDRFRDGVSNTVPKPEEKSKVINHGKHAAESYGFSPFVCEF